MSGRVLTLVLLVGVMGGAFALVPVVGGLRLWGNQEGYEPAQPIAFSHRMHAGEMQISCLYCHASAETSRHAGIPAAGTCMNCHSFVTAPIGVMRAEDEQARKEKRVPQRIVSPELQKLYDALALCFRDAAQGKPEPDPGRVPQPIHWTRVYRLPDYVYFDHRAHTAVGVTCQTCHGPVETMDLVRQVPDLTMGWCVNCHRQLTGKTLASRPVNPSVDCATCHY